MNAQLTSKKSINRLVILFTLTYMISYITRINFGAIISEIEGSTGLSRSVLSMSLTGSFITYGTGQIISGLLGDRFSPQRLISCGLITTIAMNLLIPFCASPYQMLAVWCVNGFAQSLMWPPLVRLMTSLLDDESYKKATAKVSLGSLMGTITVYLLSPAIIAFKGWRAVFFVAASAGIIMLFVWIKASSKLPCITLEKSEKSLKFNATGLFTPAMICIMLAIILQGMLRDGVTTWMPTYIADSYNLSSIISILSGVILPIVGITFIEITSAIYRKKFSNPVSLACLIFIIGGVASAALYFTTGYNATISVILSAILTGCMHGINLLLVCMIPATFKKYGNVSTASGVINSCTYIGSAISTYGIALISENMGWKFTLVTWVLISISGAMLTAIAYFIQKKK